MAPELQQGICVKGEYGWDGWLGAYFANLPEQDITILMGAQKKMQARFPDTPVAKPVSFKHSVNYRRVIHLEQKNMLPGLTREAEEQKLQEIIGIAQQNLERARADIRKVNEDLEDLLDVYEAQDKEGLALWNNATARLKENEYDLVRYEKARRKPYFGRIDFKDPNVKGDESYYIGRVGIAKNNSEPVVLDWRAPIASVYYESGLGKPCQYTVSSEGTFTIDLKRKRTYEIENDHLKDFFDSDVVANDELLTKYLAKNKKAVLGEIIATIQKEQNLIIRRSPKTNIIVQGVAGSGKTTVAMHRISYILYNYSDDFRPEDFYIIGSNRILLNYITGVLPNLMCMESVS